MQYIAPPTHAALQAETMSTFSNTQVLEVWAYAHVRLVFVHFERNGKGYPPDCAPVFRPTQKGNVYRPYGRRVLRVCSSGRAYPLPGRRCSENDVWGI